MGRKLACFRFYLVFCTLALSIKLDKVADRSLHLQEVVEEQAHDMANVVSEAKPMVDVAVDARDQPFQVQQHRHWSETQNQIMSKKDDGDVALRKVILGVNAAPKAAYTINQRFAEVVAKVSRGWSSDEKEEAEVPKVSAVVLGEVIKKAPEAYTIFKAPGWSSDGKEKEDELDPSSAIIHRFQSTGSGNLDDAASVEAASEITDQSFTDSGDYGSSSADTGTAERAEIKRMQEVREEAEHVRLAMAQKRMEQKIKTRKAELRRREKEEKRLATRAADLGSDDNVSALTEDDYGSGVEDADVTEKDEEEDPEVTWLKQQLQQLEQSDEVNGELEGKEAEEEAEETEQSLTNSGDHGSSADTDSAGSDDNVSALAEDDYGSGNVEEDNAISANKNEETEQDSTGSADIHSTTLQQNPPLLGTPGIGNELPQRAEKAEELKTKQQQWQCKQNVPQDINWSNKTQCPQDRFDDCCDENKAKSQTVGFVLQFLGGGIGAGLFYYGNRMLGGIFLGGLCLVCCCTMTMGATAAIKGNGATKTVAPWLAVAPCAFCLLIIVSWIMVLTKDVLPYDKCPLDCDL